MFAPTASFLYDVRGFLDSWLRDLEIEDPFELTGLYSGRPVGEKDGFMGELPQPDTIHLYRRPLLDEWSHGEDTLAALVTHVLVHEVGHHFGLSDDDMHAIEASLDEPPHRH